MLLLILFLILLGTTYLFFKKRYNYWKDYGVPGPEPVFPLGTFKYKGNPTMGLMAHYNNYKGKAPFIGLLNIIMPGIVVLDPSLIKKIFVRDFQYFSSRGVYHNERDDPLTGNIFNVDGQKWKRLRTKLTPTFTSGKMKYMFGTIVDVSEAFRKFLMTKVRNEKVTLEFKDILARFTTDVIGTCAFGIECQSLSHPQAKFRQMGAKFLAQPRHSIGVRILMTILPQVAAFFRLKVMPDDVADFFINVVKETVEYRIKNNVQRNDFMDLMIKIYQEDKKSAVDGGLTFNDLAAQAWIFFLAGFETSSSAMSYALYELAQNQELQERARQSVRDVLQKHDNKMTYEAMQEMTFLEQCVNESLRKYPPVPLIPRRVVKDYVEDSTNVPFREGQMVFIPVFSIQRDPDYYPDPEKYDPDRFSPEETQKRDPFVFIPFGEGPRICIGLRFGMMQSKVGLAMLLTNFRFSLNKKTPVPLTFTKDNFILTSDDPLYYDIERL